MNKYTVSDFFYFSLIMSELFADYQSIREKSYSEVLSILRCGYTDTIINPYVLALEDLEYDDMEMVAGTIKDLVHWSDEDLHKVEEYGVDTGDLDRPIVEVIA